MACRNGTGAVRKEIGKRNRQVVKLSKTVEKLLKDLGSAESPEEQTRLSKKLSETLSDMDDKIEEAIEYIDKL